MEQTLVILKPDAVERGLIGRIISYYERVGLTIKAMKMVEVTSDFVSKHYTDNEDFLRGMGNKTLGTYEKYGKDPVEEIGTSDSLEIGKMVRKWNMEYLSAGPVIVLLLEGIHAVETVRKITGSTLPFAADPGTIRGDYSIDSPVLANEKKRSIKNLVHASGTVEEAEFERDLWFSKEEILDYQRAEWSAMFGGAE